LFYVAGIATTSTSPKVEEPEQPNQSLSDEKGQLALSAPEFDSNDLWVINRTNATAAQHVHHSTIVKRARRASRRTSRKLRQERRRQDFPQSQTFKSCPTKTIYASKSTAEDMFGQQVDVYPFITIGDLNLDQHFYETFCDVEKCKCGGINNKHFKSSCRTTYSLSFGRIVKGGEIGWSLIKLRTGCACQVKQKKKSSFARNGDNKKFKF
jgi:hypothetical protein